MGQVTFLNFALTSCKLDFAQMIACLQTTGWIIDESLERRHLIDTNEAFDWIVGSINSTQELIRTLNASFSRGYMVGIRLVWSANRACAINLTRRSARFNVMIDGQRQLVTSGQVLTDVTWYCSRIVLPILAVCNEAELVSISWHDDLS